MSDSREVSQPWAEVTDLPTNAGSAPAPWTWTDLLLLASELLFGMTGRQYRGVGRSTVTVVDPQHQRAGSVPPWLPAGAGDGPNGFAALERGRGRQSVVVLPSPPVTTIQSVQIAGQDVDGAAWFCSRAGLLERLDGGVWPTDGSLTVVYDHGKRPPRGGRQACVKLALELAKVAPGVSSTLNAELANVITSVAREGTTVQAVGAVNLRDAITGGYTGLAPVDLWIKTCKTPRPAAVRSPDLLTTRTPVPLAT